MCKWLLKISPDLIVQEIKYKNSLLVFVLKAATNLCSGFPMVVLVGFSSVHSWLVFETIFRITDSFRHNLFIKVTGGYRIAGTSSLRVTVRILPLKSDLIEAAKTLIWILFTTRQSKLVKTISAHSKSNALIFTTFKKCVQLLTISL
jgi:hypothetical protein